MRAGVLEREGCPRPFRRGRPHIISNLTLIANKNESPNVLGVRKRSRTAMTLFLCVAAAAASAIISGAAPLQSESATTAASLAFDPYPSRRQLDSFYNSCGRCTHYTLNGTAGYARS